MERQDPLPPLSQLLLQDRAHAYCWTWLSVHYFENSGFQCHALLPANVSKAQSLFLNMSDVPNHRKCDLPLNSILESRNVLSRPKYTLDRIP